MIDKYIYIILILASLALWARQKIIQKRKNPCGAPYPPGPRPLPFIGNVLDIPSTDLWVKAQEWGKTYGDLVFITALGKPILFVNSYEAAVELFEKRGMIFSARPTAAMCELQDWGWLNSLISYNDRLRRQRGYMHRFLQRSAAVQYVPIQVQMINEMLLKLIEDQQNVFDHVKHMVGAIIMQIVYGYRIKETNDPYVALAENGAKAFANALLSFFVNLMPAVIHLPEWCPGTGFKKTAKEGRKLSHAMKWNLHNVVKRQYEQGKIWPCITTSLLEDRPEDMSSSQYEDLVASTTGNLYIGGANTTASVLYSFVLAMVLHPEHQARAQAELDQIVGKNCLPSLADRENLPFVNAIINECLRWQMVAPLGSPRAPSEDTVVCGYFIPKETLIFINAWAMSTESTIYPDPDKFIPERWLNEDGTRPANLRSAAKYIFGFGRRICPGVALAENTLFLAISSLLATFSFKKAISKEDGSEITPEIDFVSQFIRHSKPFPCRLEPRGNMSTVVKQAVLAGQ